MPERINQILRADSKGHYIFRRLITAARTPLSRLAESSQDPTLGLSAEICAHSLNLLSLDTIYEFSFMLRPHESKHKMADLKNRMQIYNLINFPIFETKKELKPNEICFLLISNFFNRTDAIVEKTISRNPRNNPAARGGVFLENVLTHGAAVRFTDKKGGTIRVTPYELLGHIKRIVQAFGIDVGNFDERIKRIIDGQKQNLDRLIGQIESGEITYSVEEAIRYRLETIGQYALLLGSVAYQDENQRKYFAKILMDIQRIDDAQDVLQDITIQLNPYLALLIEFGLLEQFKKIKKATLVSSLDYQAFLLIFGNRKKDGITFRERSQQIRREYQKGIDKELIL